MRWALRGSRLQLRYNLFTLICLIVLMFLQYRLWFDSDGIREMLRLKQALALQSKTTEQLKQRNEELFLQIKHLKDSNDAKEEQARSELGMIKKDETFYQVIS